MYYFNKTLLSETIKQVNPYGALVSRHWVYMIFQFFCVTDDLQHLLQMLQDLL